MIWLKDIKDFHKKWLGENSGHNYYGWLLLNPLSEFMLGIIFYLFVIILSPMLITFAIMSKRNWNGGVCKRCGVGKYVCVNYNSDRIRHSIYECNSNCTMKFRSIIDYEEISPEELKTKIRENKLKRIGV